MDGYRHYIRIDANNIVIHRFSDAFLIESGGNEKILPGDICASTDADRHFNDPITDRQGNLLYRWDGTQMVERTQDADYLLTVAKQNKLAELQTACIKSLATFVSSALGSPHTYLTDTTSMLYLEAEDRFMQGPDWDVKNILWYTIEAGDVEHTKAQIHQAYLDGRASVQNVKLKMKNLSSQVNAATTADAVNVIAW